MTLPRVQSLLFVALVCYAVATLTSMALMSIGAALCAAAIGLATVVEYRNGQITRPILSTQSKRYFWFALVYALVCVASLVAQSLSPWIFAGAPTRMVKVEWLKDLGKLWYLFWPILLAVGLQKVSPSDQKKILRIWWWAAVAISVVGILQFFTAWPRRQVIPGFENYFHVTLFFGHHLSTASILIFPFFVGPTLSLQPKVLAFGSALIGFALFGTFSRTLWVALPLGLALYGLIALGKKPKVQIALVAVMVLATTALYQAPFIKNRVQTGLGVNQRFQLWNQYLELFKSSPFLGVGFQHTVESHRILVETTEPTNDYKFVGHAHNNVLEVLVGTGLFGLLAWLAWWTLVFYLVLSGQGAKGLPQSYSAAVFCALVVYQLNGLTQVNFFESKVFHQLMFVLSWFLAQSSKRDEPSVGMPHS